MKFELDYIEYSIGITQIYESTTEVQKIVI